MISKEIEARILRLYHAEQWKIGTIATQLGLHHTTVRRVLVHAGVPKALELTRGSMIDPHLPWIRETLERYPRLRASRLFEMARARGYHGGADHFRHLIALHRPRPTAEAYLRLKTLPGEHYVKSVAMSSHSLERCLRLRIGLLAFHNPTSRLALHRPARGGISYVFSLLLPAP